MTSFDDCGLRIADCGLENPKPQEILDCDSFHNPKSSVRNRQSAIANPQSAIDIEGLRALFAHAFDIPPLDPHVMRIEVPIAATNPLEWLAAQPFPGKIYWAGRDDAFEMAGAGEADCLAGTGAAPYAALFDRMGAALSCAHPSLRYYGGLRFDAGAETSAAWSRFGAYRFVIPRYELLNRHGHSYFVCNAFRRPGEDDRRELATLLDGLSSVQFPREAQPGHRDEPAPEAPWPILRKREDLPNPDQWKERVKKVLGDFRKTELRKIVLARQVCLTFSQPLDPWAVMAQLQGSRTRSCVGGFQPEPGCAFLSATPERLYRRVSGYLQSEAMAGTRPRGDSQETDAALGLELLHDSKELREHKSVRTFVRSVFESLCREVRDHGNVSLVRLQDCQHLYCGFEGILEEGRSDAEVLQALHPTPAVGGHPTSNALEWIRAHEAFDRGWYAGPVGWVGYDSSEFAVGIRSGLVDGNSITLYAGAGIVPGSTPESEWEETESKMGVFRQALFGHE